MRKNVARILLASLILMAVFMIPVNHQGMTAEALVIYPGDWKFWLDGGWCHVWVDPDVGCTAYVYENDTLVDELSSGVSIIAAGTNFQWEGDDGGLVNVGINCTDGSTTVWLNTTYLIPITYATAKFRIFNQEGDLLPFDQFNVYVNGTQTYYDEDYLDVSQNYNVTVTDYWGDTLNETVFSFDRHIDVEIGVYKLYITNFGTTFKYIKIEKVAGSGYLWPTYLAPGEEGIWYLYNGSYSVSIHNAAQSYEYSWLVDVAGGDEAWTITGVGLEMLDTYLKGLYNMTIGESSGILSSIDLLSSTTNSFGMMFWMFVIIIIFIVVMLFSVLRRRRSPYSFEDYELPEELEQPRRRRRDPLDELADEYDKINEDIYEKIYEHNERFDRDEY